MTLKRTTGLVFQSDANAAKDSPLTYTSGMLMRNERMVVMANWLPTEPMRSVRPGVVMSLAFSLPLNAAKRLAIDAATSADTAKSSSLSDARHTPPITGMRQSHLASEMDLEYTK